MYFRLNLRRLEREKIYIFILSLSLALSLSPRYGWTSLLQESADGAVSNTFLNADSSSICTSRLMQRYIAHYSSSLSTKQGPHIFYQLSIIPEVISNSLK